MTLISVTDLSKRFSLIRLGGAEQPFLALDGVSFDLERGEVLGVVGGSGAGAGLDPYFFQCSG